MPSFTRTVRRLGEGLRKAKQQGNQRRRVLVRWEWGRQEAEPRACQAPVPGPWLGAHSLICRIVQLFPPVEVVSQVEGGPGIARLGVNGAEWSLHWGRAPSSIPMTSCPSGCPGTAWENVLEVLGTVCTRARVCVYVSVCVCPRARAFICVCLAWI